MILKPKNLINVILFILLILQACTNTYYVDGELGNNANSGTSPEKPWKTLEPVNALKLLPGDKILLKAGCEYAGTLAPHGSGTERSPIIIDSYGEGTKPVIAGNGKTENVIRLHNQRFLVSWINKNK